MTRGYAIGIDLHGTLLDEGWQIPEELAEALYAALRSIQESCELFLCTGNDLTFVQEHVGNISDLFDGYVLETGCVFGHGSDEEVLVPSDALVVLGELESRLRDEPLPGIEYFARRLASISMFTRTERGGPDPTQLYPRIMERVVELGFGEEVLVTHSDVAVDIIPAGFNKLTGLRYAAEAPVLIGIADSLNDLQLIVDADYAFLPANASPALLSALRGRGREVGLLGEAGQISGGTIAQSEFRNTQAVIDILLFLREHLE